MDKIEKNMDHRQNCEFWGLKVPEGVSKKSQNIGCNQQFYMTPLHTMQ
jgi:hypothetical protein